MVSGSIEWRRIAAEIGLWLLLYFGTAVTFFAIFSLTRSARPVDGSLAAVSFALAVVVIGLAFLAVVIDRLLFSREPTNFLTRQSVWVVVFVVLTVLATGGALRITAVTPGNAVLLGITVALPTTMILFVAINFARYRSMEHRP